MWAKLNPFPRMLATIGVVVAAVVGAFLASTSGFMGWSNAWDIAVGRLSPRGLPYPYLVWPLSVIGWLLVPAFVGAIVGAAITGQLAKRRDLDIDQLAQKVSQRVKEPQQ